MVCRCSKPQRTLRCTHCPSVSLAGWGQQRHDSLISSWQFVQESSPIASLDTCALGQHYLAFTDAPEWVCRFFPDVGGTFACAREIAPWVLVGARRRRWGVAWRNRQNLSSFANLVWRQKLGWDRQPNFILRCHAAHSNLRDADNSKYNSSTRPKYSTQASVPHPRRLRSLKLTLSD